MPAATDFAPDATLLAELPGSASLDPGSILGPQYLPNEFTIDGGQLITEMLFYAPDDTRSSGPSQHRIIVWRRNGQGFTPTS